MDMSIAHSGNASCHEVPDGYTTIVATYGQQCATSVECTRESLTTRIQDAIIVLPIMTKYGEDVHVLVLYLAHLWITLIHRLCNRRWFVVILLVPLCSCDQKLTQKLQIHNVTDLGPTTAPLLPGYFLKSGAKIQGASSFIIPTINLSFLCGYGFRFSVVGSCGGSDYLFSLLALLFYHSTFQSAVSRRHPGTSSRTVLRQL